MNQHIQCVDRLNILLFHYDVSELLTGRIRCMQLQSGIVSVWWARNDRVHGAERYASIVLKQACMCMEY